MPPGGGELFSVGILVPLIPVLTETPFLIPVLTVGFFAPLIPVLTVGFFAPLILGALGVDGICLGAAVGILPPGTTPATGAFLMLGGLCGVPI